MKILVAYPKWDNRWIPYFNKTLSRYDSRAILSDDTTLNSVWSASRDADILINMWADSITQFWATYFKDKKIISYLRRFEFYADEWRTATKWENVDALIFVSEHIRKMFNKSLTKGKPKRTYFIPNAVDLEQFSFVEHDRKPTEIAFVCTAVIHKNIGLAVQVLQALPDEYHIHHIGRIHHRDVDVWNEYLKGLGLNDRWVWHGSIPAQQMPHWLADKDFILSASITEGNPNNVIEGMACGLIPVVHNWPGAKDQFPFDHVYDTVEEAVDIIKNRCSDRIFHRKWVEEHYTLDNINKIHEVIKDIS